MKITKRELRKLIKEEAGKLNESNGMDSREYTREYIPTRLEDILDMITMVMEEHLPGVDIKVGKIWEEMKAEWFRASALEDKHAARRGNRGADFER